VLNSSTGANDPTLATAYMIKIKRWDVDITTKYISASLETVSRILDALTPRCVDLMSRVCANINTKTIRSKETDGRFDSRNGEIRKSG